MVEVMCILDRIHVMETAHSIVKRITRNCFYQKRNTVLIFETRRCAKSSNGNEASIKLLNGNLLNKLNVMNSKWKFYDLIICYFIKLIHLKIINLTFNQFTTFSTDLNSKEASIYEITSRGLRSQILIFSFFYQFYFQRTTSFIFKEIHILVEADNPS